MTSHLELRGISKVFGADEQAALNHLNQGMSKNELLMETGYTVGVHDISLQIGAGEVFVIMGLSGSGKSTLVRLINRLIEPSSGQVYLEGSNVTAMSRGELVQLRRSKMSMVFQSFALLPHLNVIDNVAFGLRVAGVRKNEAQRRAADALELVGIAEVGHQRVDQLSGGMQQRVGLARAWVTGSGIMLMDEAFSALDPLIRAEMQDALLKLQRSAKRTIVFISHDLTEAVRIADRIAVMAEGKIRQVGTPAEIMEAPADDYVRAFFRDIQPGRLFTAADIAQPGQAGTDGPSVAGGTLLEDLLHLAAENEAPLSVVGDDGVVIGCIDRVCLLQALAKVKSS